MIKVKEVSPNKVKRVAEMSDTKVYFRVTESSDLFNNVIKQEVKIHTMFVNKGKIYRYRLYRDGVYKGERVDCETMNEVERCLRWYQPLHNIITNGQPLSFTFNKGIIFDSMLPWEMM